MSIITKSLQLLGPYRMTNLLGFNGMFATYQVVEQKSQAPGALVVVHKSNIVDAAAWAKVQHETAAIAGQSIAHVCPVGGTGEEASHYFSIYSWLQGRHLGLQIQEFGIPDPAVSFEIAAQIADGLGGIHRKGVVHRIISPASIFLDETGHVHLLHAGWGRLVLGARDGLLNPAWGCIAPFVPPEIADGKEGDEASDVYALGANLFFLLTGQPPFWHDDPATLLETIRTSRPDVAQLSDALPPQAREVIEEMLARDPDERPVNLPALSDRLMAVARKLRALHQAESIPQQSAAASAEPMEEETPSQAAVRRPSLPRPVAVPEAPPAHSRKLPSEAEVAAISVPDEEADPKKKSRRTMILAGAGTVLLAGAGILGLSIILGLIGSESKEPAPPPVTQPTPAAQPAANDPKLIADYDLTATRLRALAQLAVGFHRTNSEWPRTIDDIVSLGAEETDLVDAWGGKIDIRGSFIVSAGKNQKWDDNDDIWWNADTNVRGGYHPLSRE